MQEKHSVNMKWLGKLAFETEMDGHKVITDASPEIGGEDLGPRPKRLMLTALAGCTGIDISLILKKMKVEISDMNISVEGDLSQEHPQYYTKMHVIYEFWGKAVPLKKIERAVRLSEEQYCGVSALYKKAIEVTSEIIIHEI